MYKSRNSLVTYLCYISLIVFRNSYVICPTVEVPYYFMQWITSHHVVCVSTNVIADHSRVSLRGWATFETEVNIHLILYQNMFSLKIFRFICTLIAIIPGLMNSFRTRNITFMIAITCVRLIWMRHRCNVWLWRASSNSLHVYHVG